VLGSLIIVFREVIEAGLIVGIVLAATKTVPGRSRYVAYGIGAGVAGACLVALFAGEIASLFNGYGQELFNAVILLIAVAMLTWHTVWMASHGRAMARDMRGLGHSVSAGERSLTALSAVVGIAVLREGSEVVLFLYGIAAAGGTSTAELITGGALGLLAGAAVAGLMYRGLLAIPAHRIFGVTSWLITLLAAGMAAQAILFLQQGGYLELGRSTLWNTSWLLPDDTMIGRLLHTLVGYSDAPDAAQLTAYLAIIAMIVGLTRWKRGAHA
jgi:high-affinity iron transporter